MTKIEWPGREISRAIGEELRRTREALGFSRALLVSLLPSGIGDRTLLSYEHGTRHMTVLRLVELCHVMDTDPPSLVRRGLQRAKVVLDNLALEVDLRSMLNDQNELFKPMKQWARNSLNQHPDGVVIVEPGAVRHLALFVGCEVEALALYLAKFTPDGNRAILAD